MTDLKFMASGLQKISMKKDITPQELAVLRHAQRMVEDEIKHSVNVRTTARSCRDIIDELDEERRKDRS